MLSTSRTILVLNASFLPLRTNLIVIDVLTGPANIYPTCFRNAAANGLLRPVRHWLQHWLASHIPPANPLAAETLFNPRISMVSRLAPGPPLAVASNSRRRDCCGMGRAPGRGRRAHF
jgi:hypothetical protein